METRHRSDQPEQPPQPPKEAAYAQASNPVSHAPQDQRASTQPARQYGDSLASITRRTPDSNPSNNEARARPEENRRQEQRDVKDAPNTDLEYGVEQQPAEGYIADSVQRKGMGRKRAQEGAHAGPVGSAAGPGHPGVDGERDLAADLGRKQAEHERILGDRVGQSPSAPDHEATEREDVRQRKLRQDESLDVKDAVREATGEPVASK